MGIVKQVAECSHCHKWFEMPEDDIQPRAYHYPKGWIYVAVYPHGNSVSEYGGFCSRACLLAHFSKES